MKGQRVCKMHGGRSKGAVEKAAEREQQRKADEAVRKIWTKIDDATPVKDPVGTMERLAGVLSSAADEVGQRVNDLRGVAGGEHLTQLRAEVVLLERLVGHLRAVLNDMAKLGIAERHLELDQAKAELVTAAFRAALEVLARRVDLLPADRDAVVRAFLEALGMQPPELGGAA